MLRYPLSRTINEWVTTRKWRANLEESGWHFSVYREGMILRETQDWSQHYLPISVQDKVILDVGAGEGETAKFFLDLSTQPIDFLKMDIEGYEESLLETELACPAVIEVHGLQLRDKFQKAGWRIEKPFVDAKGYSCTSYAYWKC